jgi:hypothetical protein
MNHSTSIIIGILISLGLVSCDPQVDKGVELPAPPSGSFSWSYLPGDENRVVFSSNTDEGFLHFWDFDNGLTSNKAIDTIFFQQMGSYEVSYSVFNSGGMGTSVQTVEISNTIDIVCEGTLELLTGCDQQKTWVFSQVAGAISVGPDPYSTEWYTSPASGLVDEQYDDSYQFTVNGDYIYDNQLSTISPFEGYISIALDIPELNYTLSPGTGTSGEDQIILPSCWFMGTWDSGPVYDIVELTETTLVIHGRIQNGDCSPGGGYFTFYFVAQ